MILSLQMLLKSFNPIERHMRKVQRGFKGFLEALGALKEFHSCTEEAWRASELPQDLFYDPFSAILRSFRRV